MGGASPYRARVIGGQPSDDGQDAAGGGGDKYFGLVNLKNTCYVNSVLQALYFCTTFRRRVIRQLDESDPGGETLLTSLAELFAQIENQKKNVGCVMPRRFLSRLHKANDLFNNTEHQDAHEFLQFLLNDLSEAATKRAKHRRERELAASPQSPSGRGATASEEKSSEQEPRTWVHELLQGYLVNQMKCLCCETVTVRREEFFDLSVDIDQQTSIAACLRAFESTERLRAGNKFFCDSCGCLQEAEKRLRIYQLPSVLTLHLKRFKYVERLGRCCRLPYRVVFPLQLRIVEHRDRRRQGHGARGDAAATDSQLSSDEEPTVSPPTRLFELRSVVIHIGRDPSFGHYVTVVRNGNRCVLLDDDVVRFVEPEILRSFYGTASGGTESGGEGRRRQQGGWSAAEPNESLNSGEGRPMNPLAGAPYYERAPEGTCCGYLLIYEAVDQPAADGDCERSNDWGNVADWLSETQHLDDSDSEGSEGRGSAGRSPAAGGDDGWLSQFFEQRCVPGGPGGRFAASADRGADARADAPPAAPSPSASAFATPERGGRPAGSPTGGAFAWASADSEGSRTPQTMGHGGHGIRTLGSVVPAAGSPDAVSLSRVNVVTLPSPTGSSEGGALAMAEPAGP